MRIGSKATHIHIYIYIYMHSQTQWRAGCGRNSSQRSGKGEQKGARQVSDRLCIDLSE